MSFAESTEGTRRTSTRNPRRRQRPESDSLPSQPRRKRSKISTDTFAAPEDGHANANANAAAAATIQPPTAKQNGHAATGGTNGYATRSSRKASVQPSEASQMEVAVRGGKKAVHKRAVKSDGSTVLVWNMNHLARSRDLHTSMMDLFLRT